MRDARAWRPALFAWAGAAWLTGCTAVLGIGAPSDYLDAAKAVCQCSASYDFYADGCSGDANAIAACAQDQCTSYLDAALAKAGPTVVAKWLDTFGKSSCDSCVAAQQTACILTPPICKDLGAACEPTKPECCGELGESAVCLDGTCQRCVAEGQPCTRSEECCGFPFSGNTNGYSPPYCDPGSGRCTRESPTCKKTGEQCGNATECCGYEAGLANCDSGTCFEKCDPRAPVNCPGCCTLIGVQLGKITSSAYDCLDKRDAAGSCAQLCDYSTKAQGTCADGSACSRLSCVKLDAVVSYCTQTCP